MRNVIYICIYIFVYIEEIPIAEQNLNNLTDKQYQEKKAELDKGHYRYLYNLHIFHHFSRFFVAGLKFQFQKCLNAVY